MSNHERGDNCVRTIFMYDSSPLKDEMIVQADTKYLVHKTQ